MELKALLFDTRSIQRYIFSSNRLKTNIGASALVDQVFQEKLLAVLQEIFGSEQVDADTWEKVDAPDWEQMPMKCRIGYIGGGNAFVLFQEDVPKTEIQKVVTLFTKRLLCSHPGLHTGVAYGKIGLDKDGNFFDETGAKVDDGNDHRHPLRKMVLQLKERQRTVFPETNVPYTGLTQLCTELGEAATRWDEGEFRSFEIVAKRKAGDAVINHILGKLQEVLPADSWQDLSDNYAFTDDLSKLGQMDAESYIAIVHIDGNNMGAKFAECKTLTERKNRSRDLAKTTARAFAAMLEETLAEYDDYKGFLHLGYEKGKRLLPVRPLVLGGDDMTFLCTAKLALRFARRVMDTMMREGVDTCAGIVIQPENYPFFRGYMLTEAVCGEAKKEMRALKEEGGAAQSCWLDFLIRHGEQAPDLQGIRAEEYVASAGNLHFGPYRVDGTKEDERALSNLTMGLNKLKQEGSLAKNKIKELRDVIQQDIHRRKIFLRRLWERKSQLPQVDAWKDYEAELWSDGRTPYVDLIEMLDYYEPEGGIANGKE